MSVDVVDAPQVTPEDAAARPKVDSDASHPNGRAARLAKRIGNALRGGDDSHHDTMTQLAEGKVGRGGSWLGRLREAASFRDKAKKTDVKEEARSESTSVSLIDRGYTDYQLADLRTTELVGPDVYVRSFVNIHHEGVNTPKDHEEAQAAAYRDFQDLINEGIVDPVAMAQEMNKKLDVSPDLGEVPANYGDIAAQVTSEVRQFLEAKHLNEAEAASIEREVAEFTRLYGEAYGTENVTKAYELVRDNARKLAYQAAVDKDVFSGSDHGTRHIVDGNTKFAMQMVDGLRANGLNVSAKDQLLMHQVMIDHDLGYTTGAAQAERGYNASKDHPLASAKFIEENKAYYVDKFGEDGYAAIFDSVLNHSYPRLEYQSDTTDGVHHELIRGVTSTVDSLGVTVETKTPEFFWNADAMRVLLKIRLAAEVNGGKTPPDLMEQYKEELLGIAGKETIPQRQEGYKNAINGFFSEVTANNTLGHYTGVVRSVSVEPAGQDAHSDIIQDHAHDHGDEDHGGDLAHQKLRVVVQVTPTEVYALLGNMFGDRDANQSFIKAMKDLGLDTSQLSEHGKKLTDSKLRGGETPDALDVSHENARVTVDSTFLEDLQPSEITQVVGADKIQEISKVFNEVHLLSIRAEINQALDLMEGKSPTEMPQIIDDIRDFFVDSLMEDRIAPGELARLNELLADLRAPEKANEAKAALKGFMTGREREFLGISDKIE